MGQDAEREKKVVCDWSLQLTEMPTETKERIEKGQSAEVQDIEAQHLYSLTCNYIYIYYIYNIYIYNYTHNQFALFGCLVCE